MKCRPPAYLITTDLELALERILQAYIWRWEIEVNCRDQKNLLRLGEAQVRTSRSIQTLTPLLTAVYAMLMLALEKIGGRNRSLQAPVWHRGESLEGQLRTSTAQALR